MQTLYNDDCMNVLKQMEDQSVDLTLTDIPYDEVSRKSGGLRKLDFGKADILTFDIQKFIEELYRVTRNTIIIFCGMEQLSDIRKYFIRQDGTTRTIVWEKTNPSVMNGQHVYLSGIELGVWFKRRGARTFNAFCKNTVFRHPLGSGKLHPTEKNHKLLQELILDNSNEGDLIFDPCMGSGSTGIVAKNLGRNFIGVELDEGFYKVAYNRLNKDAFNLLDDNSQGVENKSKNKKLF